MFGNLPFGDAHLGGHQKEPKGERLAYVSRPWWHTTPLQSRKGVTCSYLAVWKAWRKRACMLVPRLGSSASHFAAAKPEGWGVTSLGLDLSHSQPRRKGNQRQRSGAPAADAQTVLSLLSRAFRQRRGSASGLVWAVPAPLQFVHPVAACMHASAFGSLASPEWTAQAVLCFLLTLSASITGSTSKSLYTNGLTLYFEWSLPRLRMCLIVLFHVLPHLYIVKYLNLA